MQGFKKLSKGGFHEKPHQHVIFLDSGRGIALCSVDKKHSHVLKYYPAVPAQPAMEAQLDSNTNEELVPAQEATEYQSERIEVMPAEDGHTHVYEGEDLTLRKPENQMLDSDIVAEVKDYFDAECEADGESIKDGIESDKFYCGEQWTEKEKQYLKDRDRACVTINDTEREINKLSGQQRQSRTDIKTVPVGGTDQKVCDALNIVLKNIQEQCFYPREEAKVYLDTLITGRGNFNVYVDKSKNPEGDIIIEKMPFTDVRFGEHEKEDVSDCDHLTKIKMYSIGRIKASYPEKAAQISNAFTHFQNTLPKTVVHEDRSIDAYDPTNANRVNDIPFTWGNGTIKLLDTIRKEMCFIEQWRKKYIEVPVIVAVDLNFFEDGYPYAEKELKAIKTIEGFKVVPRVVSKMVITRIAGGVVLERLDTAELPIDDFHIVPVYATKRGNKFWGRVQSIKDPQREINKRHSQLIDIGDKAAGSGWFFDSNTFPNEKEKKAFRVNSSSPGFTAEVTDMNNKPEQVTGGMIPPVAAELLTLAHEHLRALVNSEASPNGANETNAMFTYRQKLAGVGNEFMSDNLKFAKIKLGRLLIAMIKDVYTPARIWDILKDEHSRLQAEGSNGLTLGGQSFDEFTEEDIDRIFNDADLTKVDVVVTEGVYSPAIRMAIFVVLSDLKAAGADIPMEAIIEFADIPQASKDKILEQIAAGQEAAANQETQKSQVELIKTAMGKGMATPEVMARFNEIVGVQTPVQSGGGATAEGVPTI